MDFHSIKISPLENYYHSEKFPELHYLLVLFFCLILSIRWYFKSCKNQLMIRWPIIGQLPSLMFNAHRIHDWTVDISKASGGTIVEKGSFFARVKIVYTCDPRNVKYILSTNVSNFHRGADYKEAFDILGEGLLNADSHFWMAQRRVARTTFNSKTVRNIIAHKGKEVVQDSLLILLSHCAKESLLLDLHDTFLRYSFDTSINIIFGKNPKHLSTSFPTNEFAKAMDDATEALFYRHVVPSSWWKLSRRLKIGSNERKLKTAWDIIDRDIAEYIKVKREEMVANGTNGGENDLLQVYMSIKDGEKDEMLLSKMCSDKFFRDTAFTFLIAGRDTTASALSWFFWVISKNPSVEVKILEELKLIISKKNTKGGENGFVRAVENHPLVFDADDQADMVYLHAALCETLRLYPSVPLIRKGSISDDVFPDGTVVNAGMMVLISFYAMGRMEWVWGKDCLEFRPERWIGKDGKLNPETMTKLLSFSSGPRTCIGKDMAFVLMKLAVSAIIYNFHFEVVEGQNVIPTPSIALKMKNELMVRVKERVHL
ncbi:hypothetical protein MKX03_016365 [Papaver bracteatum]|nr:hypothetical protein MKX03_016365 [Papaver bracteatum]